MTKVLWKNSHVTKAHAANSPSTRIRQNHGANLAPEISPKPTTIGTTKPATPIRGLGNPRREACHRSKRAPHDTKGLMSQASASCGFCRERIRSIKSAADANQPMQSPMISD